MLGKLRELEVCGVFVTMVTLDFVNLDELTSIQSVDDFWTVHIVLFLAQI